LICFLFESYTEIDDEILKADTRLDRVVCGHAFVEMGATGGKDSYTAFNVGVGFVFNVDGGAARECGEIGVEFFGTASEIDVDMWDEVFGRGVRDESVSDIGEELLTGVADFVGFGANTRAKEVEVTGVSCNRIVEAYDGLIKACVFEVIPLDNACTLRSGDGINLVEKESSEGIKTRCDGDGRFGDERKVAFLDEWYGVGVGEYRSVDGVADAEAIFVIFAQSVGGNTVVDRLGNVSKVAGVAVDLGIDERDGVFKGGAFIGEQCYVDSPLRIVDGVGVLTVAVYIAFGKIASLDTDPGGVVVLVEQAIDNRDVFPLGVWGEFHLAASEEDGGQEEWKKVLFHNTLLC
jgi:hypothetical protein